MNKTETSYRCLFFVGVSIKLFFAIIIAKIFNWRIYCFDDSKRSFQFKILQKMDARGWIVRITEQHHAFYDSHTLAIETAERLVDENSDDNVFQLLRKLYNNKETDLVFKKTIAKHLSLLTSINHYILNNHEVIEPTLFISNKYRNSIQINQGIIDQSITVKYEIYLGDIKLKVIWLLVLLGYILHILAQPFLKKNTDKKFKYAISVPFPWATKFKGAREFTFLVDDDIVKKNETVFLIEYPETKEFYQRYSAAGYNLREATGLRKWKNLFRKTDLKIHYEYQIIFRLFMARKKDVYIYESLVYLLTTRISWLANASNIPFSNYIYFNKEGENQIAANIILKGKSIMVHAYSQFVGGAYQVCGRDSYLDKRNIHWSFLNPNYYYLNNHAMMDSMLLHHHSGVEYKVIGNIFSEKIHEFRQSGVKAKFIDNSILQNKKVVTIFDTTYISVSKFYSNYEEAVRFLEDVINLAKSYSSCIFLFKPSKNQSFFIDSYWAEAKGSRILKLRQEFDQLSNAFMLSDCDDVIDVISVSDVVFTNCFSSPTTDALLARVPAFWYQAKTDVSFSVYNTVPGLVIYGYKNLCAQVNHMLQDNYSLNVLSNPQFIHLVGDSEKKALTTLRLVLTDD